MPIKPRGRAAATLKAQRILDSRKTIPNKRQIKGIASRCGIHWTTVYRLMRSKVLDSA